MIHFLFPFLFTDLEYRPLVSENDLMYELFV